MDGEPPAVNPRDTPSNDKCSPMPHENDSHLDICVCLLVCMLNRDICHMSYRIIHADFHKRTCAQHTQHCMQGTNNIIIRLSENEIQIDFYLIYVYMFACLCVFLCATTKEMERVSGCGSGNWRAILPIIIVTTGHRNHSAVADADACTQ